MRLLAFLLLCVPLLSAEDTRLAAIRAWLVAVKSAGSANADTRGASPALTQVKHDLIAWIESRIPVMQWNGSRWHPNPTVLQEQLNDELDRAGLFCGSSSDGCREGDELGYLGPIVLDMQRGSVLIIRTSAGIQNCGGDESAYAYRADENGRNWQRIWESEQNDYEKKYSPETFDQVLISPSDFHGNADRSEHLILTLGHEPWCSSNWHDVYYRVWQTKSGSAAPKLMLDGREWSFIDDSIQGSVTRTDALFEYTTMSIEGGFSRPEIRHYEMRDSRLVCTDPVALNPRDFVAFWLTHPWLESSLWTAETSRLRLQEWRRQNEGPFAEFAYPTRHCAQPDLWQVSTDAGEEGKQHPVYFVVRWRPPYHFTMMSAGDRSSLDCTEEDRQADERRSLFPRR
jgi:hypothetical protein